MMRLFIMSAVGGFVSLILFLLKPLAKRLFGHTWQYYIWLVPLIIFVLPISFEIPVQVTEETKIIGVISPNAIRNAGKVLESTSEAARDSGISIAALWVIVALGIFALRMARYAVFCRKIKKGSRRDFGMNLPFPVRRCKTASPVLVGLLKPVLYIPKELSGRELELTIAHETVHYKRRDILYKWFAVLVQTVHWFNPLAYAVLKNIDEDCEISCDGAVSKSLDESGRKDYMRLILDMASKKHTLTTQMASSKVMIKKRFTAICAEHAKPEIVVLCIITVFVASFSVMFSGFAAGIKVPEKTSVTEVANKPVLENRGFIESESKAEAVNQSELKTASETIPEGSYASVVHDDIYTSENSMETASELNNEPIAEVAVSNEYLPGDLVIYELDSSGIIHGGSVIPYDTDVEEVHSLTVCPGADGKVSLHFDCDTPEAVADISISGLSEACDTVGYNVPTNPAYRYDICGLEPGKEYVVEINAYCPGNYDINGNITIIEE